MYYNIELAKKVSAISKITLASSAEVWLINLLGEPFNHFYSNDMEGLGLTGVQEVFLASYFYLGSAIPSKWPHRFGQSYCRRAAYLLRDYAYQRKVPATSAASSKHTTLSAPKFVSTAPTPTTAPARPLILSTSTSTASQ